MACHSLLFLLVFLWAQTRSLAAVFDKDIILPWPCEVKQSFKTPLVKAYSEKGVAPIEGCLTNATNLGSEVHVINYIARNASSLDIELVLKDFHEQGFEHPFIIILSSNVETHWKIRLGRDVRNPGKHLFVTSKDSGIRFTNKHLRPRPRTEKERSLPSNTSALLQWVASKYGFVTSMSMFKSGNSITLTIGQAAPSSDVLLPLPAVPWSPSQCSVQPSSSIQLPVSAIHRRLNNVAGCVVDSSRYPQSGTKYAYVVEMKNVPQRRAFVVDVDLRLGWNSTDHVNFWLVLKSSSNVKWRVHARHSEGYIIFVSNGDVDDEAVHITSTAMRREYQMESGEKLLSWVQVHLGRVAMYVSLNSTSSLRLTLPHIAGEEKMPPVIPELPVVMPDWSLEQTLQRALRTHCDSQNLTVAIDSNVLHMFGIQGSTLSLMDRRCKAQRNNTHVYIESQRDTCGTKFLRTQQGHMQYVNSLVVQAAGLVTEGGYDTYPSLDTLEPDGSGDGDVFSGSGADSGSELVLDDEDLHLRSLEISFSCDLLPPPTKVGTQAVPMFQLELFHSDLYISPYARLPVELPSVGQRLYLQVMLTSNPLLQANFDHCWLSSADERTDQERFTLVQNGCLIDSSVRWEASTELPQSDRLSFTVEGLVQQISAGSELFLKCQMTVCCLSAPCIGTRYPQCVGHQLGNCKRHPSRHYIPPSRHVSLGPILLPKIPDYYEVKTTVSPDPTTASKTEAEMNRQSKRDQVVIEGLDSGTVIGIAFAAFIIGVLMMGALWFIHTHSGSIFTSGPFKRSFGNRGSSENEVEYGETTPGSSAPISA